MTTPCSSYMSAGRNSRRHPRVTGRPSRLVRLAGVAAVCGVLAGCGAGSGEPSATVTQTVTAAPSSDPTAADEPTEQVDPYAPNVGDRSLQVGQARRGEDVSTTLLEVRDPYPPAQYRTPAAGAHFFGLRIAQCLAEDATSRRATYSSYNGEFYVKTMTNDQYQGDGSSYGDFPSPKFPETVTLNPGDCLKGWLTLEIPDEAAEPTTVIFRPGGKTVAEWNL